MNVLVTGGSGFIGTNLIALLLEQGDKVLNFDINFPPKIPYKGPLPLFREGDVRDLAAVAKAIEVIEPDVIVHLAAQSSPTLSWKRPGMDLDTNAGGTMNVAMAAADAQVGYLFVASSAAVYGHSDKPHDVDEPLAPTTPYGVSKMAAENYARLFFPGCCIGRFGNVYGPWQKPVGDSNLVPKVVDHILRKAPFSIRGTGEAIRDFIYVEDLVRAIQMLMWRHDTVNVATGILATVNEICDGLAMALNVGPLPAFRHIPSDPTEPERLELDVHPLRKLFVCEVGISSGLSKTAHWYKKHEEER